MGGAIALGAKSAKILLPCPPWRLHQHPRQVARVFATETHRLGIRNVRGMTALDAKCAKPWKSLLRNRQVQRPIFAAAGIFQWVARGIHIAVPTKINAQWSAMASGSLCLAHEVIKHTGFDFACNFVLL